MVGEVDRGPRWNVNFLRSMRPEPGPGQSGQEGAAILTSKIQQGHYYLYLTKPYFNIKSTILGFSMLKLVIMASN